jgi:hypothetical protein
MEINVDLTPFIGPQLNLVPAKRRSPVQTISWLAQGLSLCRITVEFSAFQTATHIPSEMQASNIKLNYGNSPETERLSRREKIVFKLTTITKTINKD